jgi:hypothetical protein
LNRALSISASRSAAVWWLGVALIASAALVAPPMPEPVLFRTYVDQREIAGIPFFWNVVSNAPLLLVGIWGVRVVVRANRAAFIDSAEKLPYALCFMTVALAGIGSTWFHLAPNADRLMWDRLPIALGFMALLAGVIGDRFDPQAGRRAVLPLLAAGAASVFYWRWSMLAGAENIVPYALVQYGALAAIVALAFVHSRYTRGSDLFTVGALYGFAKAAEVLDRQIYQLGGILSGHALKHLLAAAALYWLARMLQCRAASPPS